MDYAEERITVMTSLNFCTQESGVKGGEASWGGGWTTPRYEKVKVGHHHPLLAN